MATFQVTHDSLTLHFSAWESLGAIRSDVTVPLRDIDLVEVVADPWSVVSGLRVGTAIPWVILLGTMLRRGKDDVVALYHRRPAIVVTLKKGAAFQRLMATVREPEVEAERLRRAARMAGDGSERT